MFACMLRSFESVDNLLQIFNLIQAAAASVIVWFLSQLDNIDAINFTFAQSSDAKNESERLKSNIKVCFVFQSDSA